MLHSYHTAFYICGATTTLSVCLMFLIPWLVPNQQGGVFRRDSAQSRLESLLSSQASTPKRLSRKFFAESSMKSCSSEGSGQRDSEDGRGDSSLCEADRIELEYLKSFATCGESNDHPDGEKTPLSQTNSISMDTSINTAINSTMSHRGSITKYLLQQQLQSQSSRSPSPLSDSCRGSAQGATGNQSLGGSSRSSMSSYFGGSRRTSFSSPKSKTSSKASQSNSRRGSNGILGEDLGETNSEESSELNSSEVEQEIGEFPKARLPLESRRESGESTVVGSRWESGQSTVVCSHRSSVIKVTGSPRISQVSDSAKFRSVKDPDMLHVLAARLLQATREREEGDGKEPIRETVV